MEIEEIIGILIGSATAPGLIYVIYTLGKKIHKAYNVAKAAGFTSVQALNIAIRSINIKEPSNKGKK